MPSVARPCERLVGTTPTRRSSGHHKVLLKSFQTSSFVAQIMFENTVLRKQPILWGLRFAQAVIAIVALGITGSDAAGWHDLGCGTPAKVAYNISAVSALSPPAPKAGC